MAARICGGKKRSNPCSQEFARPFFGGQFSFVAGTTEYSKEGLSVVQQLKAFAFFSVISVSLLTYLSRGSHRRTFLMVQRRSSELIPPQRQMKVNR